MGYVPLRHTVSWVRSFLLPAVARIYIGKEGISHGTGTAVATATGIFSSGSPGPAGMNIKRYRPMKPGPLILTAANTMSELFWGNLEISSPGAYPPARVQ